jgi:sporulation-control protein spo0M
LTTPKKNEDPGKNSRSSIDALLDRINNHKIREIANKLANEIMTISNDIERRISKSNVNFYAMLRFCSIFQEKRGFCFEVRLPKNDFITGNLDVTLHPSNQDWSYIHVNEFSELSLLINAAREAYIRATQFSSLKN